MLKNINKQAKNLKTLSPPKQQQQQQTMQNPHKNLAQSILH